MNAEETTIKPNVENELTDEDFEASTYRGLLGPSRSSLYNDEVPSSFSFFCLEFQESEQQELSQDLVLTKFS